MDNLSRLSTDHVDPCGAHRASRVARIGIDRVEAISGDRYLRLATNT